MKNNQYYISAVTAFVMWGFITLPLRQLAGYTSGQILFFRILTAVTILLIILFTARKKALLQDFRNFKLSGQKEQIRTIALTVGGGILLTANWLSFIYVVNHITIQAASFAYLLCPILTAVLGYLILKEKLKPRQWLAIGISLGSCCLLGVASFTNLMFSLLIASTYAFYLITQRLVKQYDKIVQLTLQLILSFILIFSFGVQFRGATPTEGHFYLNIIILSSLFTVIPLFLNLYALKELKSATIGILMYINPMINFAIAFFYFKEEASAMQLLAYTLILLSVVLYNVSFRKSKPVPVAIPATK